MEELIMKKVVSLVIALVLALSCTAALAELTFTTGGTSGTYYAFGNVLAQYITNNSDVAVTAIAGNGSAANIDLLDIGDAQLGFVQNDVANYAYNGIRFEQYEGNPIDSFTALCALYTETVQLVTCNPDIKSVEDLKGKNVSIGSQGSGVYFNAMDFFAAYDMTEADINPQYLSFGDSAEALKDGKIDAAFVVAGAPTPAVVDLATTKGCYLIGLDDAHVEKLQAISSAYAKSVIPAGTYEGIDEDITTVGVKATIIANGQVSDDEAYAIVSTIFENVPAITEAHAKGAELDVEYASSCGLPYHPGAAKYFAEKGIEVEAK
jgi:TRAP transporter TAXI family solute receptor